MAAPPGYGPSKPRQKSVKGETVSGSKWVSSNWEALAEATEANGGKVPYSIALVTSDFPNKNTWSEENLPTILFYLTPPVSTYEGRPVQEFTRNDGKELRSFDLLPDRIAVDVKGWLIEAWRRLDPRISYEDILARMTPDPDFCRGRGLTIPSKNSLQMYTLRSCRKILGYWQLEGNKEEPSRAMVEAIENLTPYNLLCNTVLPICNDFPNRLVKLKFERKTEDGQFKAVPHAITADNVEDFTFPLDFFCQPLAGYGNPFSVSVDRAWETLLMLQERAEIHGLSHWSKLHKNCRPVSWQTRTKGAIPSNRPDYDKDGDDRIKAIADTYDGGCSICTWRPKPQTTETGQVLRTLKRRCSDDSDIGEWPNARRARTEAYGTGLFSSNIAPTSCMDYSSPSAYASISGQGHYADNSTYQAFNSSPPSYCGAASSYAYSTATTSEHTASGVNTGSGFTPILPPPRSPTSKSNFVNFNINSAPTVLQSHQARPWDMNDQYGQVQNGFAYANPPMSRSLPYREPRNDFNAPVGFGQSLSRNVINTDPCPVLKQRQFSNMHQSPPPPPPPPRFEQQQQQLQQSLSDVQQRTLNLQRALGNPAYDLPVSGGAGSNLNLNGHQHMSSARVGLPARVSQVYGSGTHESSDSLEHIQCQGQNPTWTDPVTAYEPSLPNNDLACCYDTSPEPQPNMDWNYEVLRNLLHSDEANEADPEVAKVLSSLPDGAAVKDMWPPLPMQDVQGYPAQYGYGYGYGQHQHCSSEDFAANPDFLDQPLAE